MMRRFVKTASAALLVAALLPSGQAQAKLVQRFGAWSLFVHEEGRERTCFVTATPVKQEGTFRKRDQPRMFVTRFPVPPPNEQVMVDPGYPYRKGSNADLSVDGRKFELFTQESRAWARSPAEDAALIAAFRGGQQTIVRGTSHINTTSIDTYDLTGFTAAHQAMGDTCGSTAAR